MTFFSIVIQVIVLLFVWTRNAHAYLDPGTGSYIVQILIAVIFAGWFAIKFFYRRVLDYFAKTFSKRDKRDEDEN